MTVLHLCFPHQARVETSLPEVHPPCDPLQNTPGSVDAQHIGKYGVGKYKRSIRVPNPIKNTLLLHGQ